jgi:hypothetical protein
MKSGPRELAEFHASQLALDGQRRNMTHARTTLPNEEREVDPEAAAKVAKLLAKEGPDLIDGQDDAAPKPGYHIDCNGKLRKDRGPNKEVSKPKVVKAATPTADLNKRKHLALIDKLYGLKEKQAGLLLAIDQTHAEINALIDAL